MIRYKINKLMILQFNKSVTSGLDAPFDKCKIYLSNRLINASKSKQSLRCSGTSAALYASVHS